MNPSPSFNYCQLLVRLASSPSLPFSYPSSVKESSFTAKKIAKSRHLGIPSILPILKMTSRYPSWHWAPRPAR